MKKRVGKAGRCGSHRRADLSRGNGADDESTRSDSEGSGRQADVGGGCRDHGRDRPDDAALARAIERAWLQRVVGLPEAAAEPEASADGDGGKGVAVVPGAVLRFQRAALSREAA